MSNIKVLIFTWGGTHRYIYIYIWRLFLESCRGCMKVLTRVNLFALFVRAGLVFHWNIHLLQQRNKETTHCGHKGCFRRHVFVETWNMSRSFEHRECTGTYKMQCVMWVLLSEWGGCDPKTPLWPTQQWRSASADDCSCGFLGWWEFLYSAVTVQPDAPTAFSIIRRVNLHCQCEALRFRKQPPPQLLLLKVLWLTRVRKRHPDPDPDPDQGIPEREAAHVWLRLEC